MTIEEAKEVIEQDIPCEFDADLIEALHMAIKSLEAWEDIRQEIIKRVSKVPTFQNEYLNGLKTAYAHALAIIDEHLQEIKNG